MLLNKEINHLWLSVTSNCNFKCGYCYVNKKSDIIDFKIAKSAVKMLIDSPGNYKTLDIYGGEPLLAYKELNNILSFAQKYADDKNKKLDFKMATNSSLFKKSHLPFLKNFQIKLSLSLDGDKTTHDAFRKFKNNEGTFDTVKRNALFLIENYSRENVQALMTVHPGLVDKLYENFVCLKNIGFENFHINSVATLVWSTEKRKVFVKHLKNILNFILIRLNFDDFIFFEPVNQAIKRQLDKKGRNAVEDCPFYKRLTIFPSGKFALLPDLCYEKEIENYIIGDIHNISKKNVVRDFSPVNLIGDAPKGAHYFSPVDLKLCTYSLESENCIKCIKNFRHLETKNFEYKIIKMRNFYGEKFARFLIKKAEKLANGDWRIAKNSRIQGFKDSRVQDTEPSAVSNNQCRDAQLCVSTNFSTNIFSKYINEAGKRLFE